MKGLAKQEAIPQRFVRADLNLFFMLKLEEKKQSFHVHKQSSRKSILLSPVEGAKRNGEKFGRCRNSGHGNLRFGVSMQAAGASLGTILARRTHSVQKDGCTVVVCHGLVMDLSDFKEGAACSGCGWSALCRRLGLPWRQPDS